MPDKRYISPLEYQHDQWTLAEKIFDSGWCPDIMIALWRGGAGVGVTVHEFLSFREWQFDHTCVKCSSYADIGEREEQVKFDEAAEFVFSRIKKGAKVLIVDDVFDTGKTIEAIVSRLTHTELRSACVYWKDANNLTSLKPDYYVATVNDWIVFPHELQGLTAEEIETKDTFLTQLPAR